MEDWVRYGFGERNWSWDVPAEALLFKVKPGVEAPAYWRFTAYDHYSGFTWTQSVTDTTPAIVKEPTQQPVFNVEVPLGAVNPTVTARLTLPVPEGGAITRLQPSQNLSYSQLQRDAYDGYVLSFQVVTPSSYEAVAYMTEATDQELDPEALRSASFDEIPSDVARLYLQVPGGEPQVVAETAAQLRVGSSSVLEQAIAVERFLLENFTYGGSLERAQPGEDLVAYLLRTKSGVCRHFATAMAILSRRLGVPARVVVGALNTPLTTYLDRGGNERYFLGASLHAWVEVYVPRAGWLPFDPTPPAQELEVVPFSPSSNLRFGWSFLADLSSLFFEPYVEMLTSFNPPAPWGPAGYPAWFSFPPLKVPAEAIFAFAVTAAFLIVWLGRPGLSAFRRRRAAQSRSVSEERVGGQEPTGLSEVSMREILTLAEQGRFREAVVRCYYRFLWALGRRGLLKRKSMTAWEYAEFTKTTGVEAIAVDELTDSYEEAFFSQHRIGEERLSSSLDALAKVERGQERRLKRR